MFPPRTPGDIEVEILMSRQVHRRSFLLLEGSDDSKFWRGRIAKGNCDIVVAEGKSNVIGAIERLDTRQFTGVLGIVDDDFDTPNGCQFLDKFSGHQYSSANLIGTDASDLECLLLRSPALESVLQILGDEAKIQQYEQRTGMPVREGLLQNGLAFGRFRWMDSRRAWNMNISVAKELKPERFIDRDTWETKDSEILETVSRRVELSTDELRGLIDRLPNVDPWFICQGHDMTEILRLGLQSVLGNLKSTQTKKEIADSLMLAFHDIYLAATRLYADIKNWEQLNFPYQILQSQVITDENCA